MNNMNKVENQLRNIKSMRWSMNKYKEKYENE